MINSSNNVDLFINKVMDYMTDNFILVEKREKNFNIQDL